MFFFSPVFSPVRTVMVPLLMIFGIKKGCNLVSVRYYIATGRTLFIKRRLALSRFPARRYVVYNKVPWLCVTASRRFCRQVFNYYEGKSTSGLCRSSPSYFHYTHRKTPCQVFLSSVFRKFLLLHSTKKISQPKLFIAFTFSLNA